MLSLWMLIFFIRDSYSNYDYRLPKTILPIEYNLHLKVHLLPQSPFQDINEDYKFFGNLSILLQCYVETKFILLHSKKLHIFPNSLKLYNANDISEDSEEVIDIDIEHIENYQETEQIRIPLKSFLKSGKKYILYINYQGTLTDKPVGFYFSRYKENNSQK